MDVQGEKKRGEWKTMAAMEPFTSLTRSVGSPALRKCGVPCPLVDPSAAVVNWTVGVGWVRVNDPWSWYNKGYAEPSFSKTLENEVLSGQNRERVLVDGCILLSVDRFDLRRGSVLHV